MQTRREVLEEKFTNFRSYLRANSPIGTLQQLEEEILQRETDDVIVYIQTQANLNPEEGAGHFIDRYSIPACMRSTVHRYFACFDYLLNNEEID
jgi:hypothetical protein